jgi:hypothetical protein
MDCPERGGGLNSSTKAARMRRRSGVSTMTVAVAGRSATTPCLRWKMNRGWAARFASQLRVFGSRDPAQVDVVPQTVEDDLDPSGLAGSPARGGDVDRAVLDRRRAIDGQRLAYVLPHGAWR